MFKGALLGSILYWILIVFAVGYGVTWIYLFGMFLAIVLLFGGRLSLVTLVQCFFFASLYALLWPILLINALEAFFSPPPEGIEARSLAEPSVIHPFDYMKKRLR